MTGRERVVEASGAAAKRKHFASNIYGNKELISYFAKPNDYFVALNIRRKAFEPFFLMRENGRVLRSPL